MRKLLCTFMICTMLVSSSANAGILILTGDIGNKFHGYKAVGLLTIVLTGATILGLIVDEDDQVATNIQLPELSEASISLIEHATAEVQQFADETKSNVVTTISNEIASQIVMLEGLDGTQEGRLLFKTLTTK